MRAACASLQALAKDHPKAIAQLVVGVLPTLLRNLYVSVKAISNASHETAVALVAAAPSSPALAILLRRAIMTKCARPVATNHHSVSNCEGREERRFAVVYTPLSGWS